jgi:hypothetical protein
VDILCVKNSIVNVESQYGKRNLFLPNENRDFCPAMRIAIWHRLSSP